MKNGNTDAVPVGKFIQNKAGTSLPHRALFMRGMDIFYQCAGAALTSCMSIIVRC
nr:MAG TPA: hypothetical protein [Caudoviricetes sp.]